jgi:NTP pyrophosphatase (non-canonical NTP hydrolase)
MTNPFRDQEKFMKACDQTTDNWNVEQFNLYVNLIEEEFSELKVAIKDCDPEEIVDALADILFVTIVAAHSMGCDI